MRFGTWNDRSLCRLGSLNTVESELAKYNLHLVSVKVIRGDEGSSQPAYDCILVYGDGNVNHHLQTGFSVHKGIILRRRNIIRPVMGMRVYIKLIMLMGLEW
jgi:hypothetical protein